MEITKSKIRRILKKYLRGEPKKQIGVLKDCVFDIEEKIRKEEAEKAERLRKKEEKEAILKERLRIHNYKPIRFKKPLKPIGERRQYTRCCRKCDKYYRTFAKYGMVCDSCKESGVNDEVPPELNNLVR